MSWETLVQHYDEYVVIMYCIHVPLWNVLASRSDTFTSPSGVQIFTMESNEADGIARMRLGRIRKTHKILIYIFIRWIIFQKSMTVKTTQIFFHHLFYGHPWGEGLFSCRIFPENKHIAVGSIADTAENHAYISTQVCIILVLSCYPETHLKFNNEFTIWKRTYLILLHTASRAVVISIQIVMLWELFNENKLVYSD